MKEDGITPKETRYQTEKQFLRNAIDDVASTARSPEEFSKILDEKYHIIFKISRNRYSYLHPVRKKYITGIMQCLCLRAASIASSVSFFNLHGSLPLNSLHELCRRIIGENIPYCVHLAVSSSSL